MRSTKLVALKLSIVMLAATVSLPGHRALGSAAMEKTYTTIPMSFEKNAGQSRAGVDFIARGSGYTVFLTPGEAVIALKKHEQRGATVRMSLVDSVPARAAGENELPGKANYFVGNDPAKWRRDVATFERVRYRGVYPGIDVVYYGNQNRLEYDFIVSPGADPDTISLDFMDTDIDIANDGNLVLDIAGASLSMLRPYIYQEIGGEKRVITGNYVKRAGGRIGFSVGPYDTARPLVIDPVLLYSTYLGGSGSDSVNAIAVDQAGNAYITGETVSNDFPTQNPMQPLSGAGTDAFIAKIDPSGSALVYSTYFGGNGADFGHGIAVDALGNVFVSGRTESSNFPTTPGAFQTAFNGGTGDAFVAKLNPSGSALIYSTYIGGDSYDAGRGIAIDTAGNAYVTGYFYIEHYPVTIGAFQTVNRGAYDAFLTKLDPAGAKLLYSTYLGGIGDDNGLAVAVDSQGNAIVTGSTGSNNFPMLNAAQGVFGGNYDAFVTKVNANGSELVYSTYAGGDKFERGSGVGVDALGNAYAAGQSQSSNFPTTAGASQPVHGGDEDAWVVKINPNGGSFAYSTYLGGPEGDAANAIAVDAAGNAYVTGNNYRGGFPLKDPLQSTYHWESFEGFVTKLAPDSALVYSTYLGGAGNDAGLAIAVDSLGSVYVGGSTQSTDFPITPGAHQEANAGSYDGFVAKIAAASIGKITGGGSIAVGGDIGTFGFTVQRATANAPIKGNLQYVDHSTGDKLSGVTFTSLSIGETTATFAGTCMRNGVPCNFTVQVTDNGEPGNADAFIISVSGLPAQGGTLRSGNIQIR